MTSAAHAKKRAMGLPMEERLSEEDLIVTVEYLSWQRALLLAFEHFNKGFC
ncbi:hypothetical protein ACFFP0_13400 [Rhizobium puerariae]|uniref:Uncharacterized protein n=1 Tax=Rhizobium puerariae TaxID=1585791 RepID=A0ABV6AKI2_9HYPH